jgi:DNA-binding beta-propeller fold protein YncE
VNRLEFLALAASAPFALRAGRSLAAPVEAGLVTCDTESRIAVVDLRAGRVLRTIGVPRGPRSLERVGDGLALACHTEHGLVTIVDGRAGAVRHVVRGLVEPRYTARHPDGVHAFVSDSARGLVASIDVRRGLVLGTARLGGPARHLSLSPDARTLWVSLGSTATRVSIVDVSVPALPRPTHSLAPPFPAHDVGVLPGGARTWVTAGAAGTMALYRGDTVELTLAADPGPQHVSFGRGVAYVTSGDAGTFRVHSLADGSVRRETRVPIGSYNVQSGPGGLVLTPALGRGTLCVLNAGGELLHEVQVSSSSHDACFVF